MTFVRLLDWRRLGRTVYVIYDPIEAMALADPKLGREDYDKFRKGASSAFVCGLVSQSTHGLGNAQFSLIMGG
ncbi:MAG: hypothetical protein ACE5JS_00165 [Nitrospinota bacterium]